MQVENQKLVKLQGWNLNNFFLQEVKPEIANITGGKHILTPHVLVQIYMPLCSKPVFEFMVFFCLFETCF